MKWFDIRKKKPVHKEWKQYIVYVNTGLCIPLAGIKDSWSYKLAMYCNKDGFCIDGQPTDRITHWMPMPKDPPKHPAGPESSICNIRRTGL